MLIISLAKREINDSWFFKYSSEYSFIHIRLEKLYLSGAFPVAKSAEKGSKVAFFVWIFFVVFVVRSDKNILKPS